MTQYNNNHAGCEPFSDMSYKLGLTASTLSSQVLPGTSAVQYRVEFSWPSDAIVWVGFNVEPVIPTAPTVEAANNCALNPKVRFARGGDTLNFMSDSGVTNAGFELLTISG